MKQREPKSATAASLVSRLARHETLIGAAVLAVLVLFFLSQPLSRFREVYYSSADLTQDFCLTRIDPHHQAGNKLMSDAVTQMQPWLMFNRDELRAGRVPLWNPYNGTGCPHLGNYQSAVFSPFSLPFYFLSVRAALVASAFLKLWALGFFTFLFLKEIGARQVAALIGATAFMFCGHNVLLLSFPHVAAMVALPAGFYFVERAIRRIEKWFLASAATPPASPRPRIFWPLFGLTASFTVGLLAGNPEPFYFAALFVALFAGVRLAGAWSKLRRKAAPGSSMARATREGASAATREVARLAVGFSASCVLAAGLTAFQTLTFFEYLSESRVLEQRSAVQTPLYPAFWPLMMFPNVIGNPSTEYNISYEVPSPNYELTNTAYVGGLVVLLAALSLLFAHKNRFIVFFAATACAWAFYAYNFFGASALFEWIPTLDRAPINRSQGIWLFCLSVCAALCIDHLLKRESSRTWFKAAATLAAGAALLAACVIGADRLIERYAYFPSPNHGAFLSYVPQHIRWISAQFGAGCFAVALMWLTRVTWMRTAVAVSVLAVVFTQNGWLFKQYNPITENRYFFPVTPAVAELQQRVGQHSLAILGEDKIPPDSNLPYKLSLITNYDGMWVKDYDAMFRDTFGNAHNWRPVLRGSERGLDLFGVEYILAKWGWMNIDNGMATHTLAPNAELARHEILPERQASQIFTARKDRLQALCVWLGTFPSTPHCTLTFRLGEARSGRTILERQLSSEEVQADIYSNGHTVFPSDLHLYPNGRPVLFTFDPIPDSKDKQYRWTISCNDARSAEAVVAWTRNGPEYKEGSSYWGKRQLKEPYLFDVSYNLEDFERITDIGDYVLYRYKKSLGKFHTVAGALIAASEQEALHLPRSAGFDPRRLVVLSADSASTLASVTPLDITGPRDNSTARLVKTRDDERVYLVSSDGRSLIHIEDQSTFSANKFKWEQIQIVTPEELAKFTILDPHGEEARRAGLWIVPPDVPDKSPLAVLEDRSTYAHIEVERTTPGFLVIDQAHFPGWKARVNGVEKPVYRANFAFSAVELPSGPCDIEFFYDPDSLRLGIWLGVASLCVLCAWFALSLRAI